MVDDRTVVERPPRMRRERVHRPFHIGNILAIIGGAALAVIGIVALVRGDLNDTWDEPVTTVLRIDHTPLLAAIEVGAGAILVLFAVTAQRFLALLASVGLAVAAVVVAIEPGRLATQYALEEWWAWTVAGGAAIVALACLLPGRRRKVAVEEDERVLAER
jgi:peptidoglycan/LPS O-acetylase OafA/YrhL